MSINMTPRRKKQDDGIARPRSIREIPAYLGKVISGFFGRLLYVVSLVWEAAPALLIAMIFLCLLDGVLPVVGAYISKDLLNKVASLIGVGGEGDFITVIRPLVFLFVLYFVYLLLKKLLARLNTMVTNISGELVVNHIKLKIINKAKQVVFCKKRDEYQHISHYIFFAQQLFYLKSHKFQTYIQQVLLASYSHQLLIPHQHHIHSITNPRTHPN